MHSQISEIAAPPYGPTVVRAAFVLAVFGWGTGFYSPSIYLAEVIHRTGWSLGMVSAAVTAHFVFGAVIAANLPRIYAGIGLPLSTIIGALLTAAGVVGWASAAHPWQLFCAALASGMGWVAMGAVGINTIVSRWYVTERPAALGKAYNGASIGGVIFAPLWVALNGRLGFLHAAMMIGIIMVVTVTALSVFVFSKTPAGVGQTVDAGTRRAMAQRSMPAADTQTALPGRLLWRNRAFVTLVTGMAAGLFAQMGLLEHLFEVLTPALGAQATAALMGFGTACAIVGRTAAARAITKLPDRRRIAAVSYSIQALGTLTLLFAYADWTWLVVPGIALFGLGIGNATSLPPLIAQTDFAAKDVARVVALSVAIGQGAYAFAPALFGLMLSKSEAAGVEFGTGTGTGTGNHTGVFFVTAIVIQLSAAAIFMAGKSAEPDSDKDVISDRSA